jgi:hypothetical protein
VLLMVVVVIVDIFTEIRIAMGIMVVRCGSCDGGDGINNNNSCCCL